MGTDSSTIIQSGSEFFSSLVEQGIESRGLSVSSPVIQYLTNMLTFYVDARNLHEPEYDESGRRNPQTLAEMWLVAQTSEPMTQKELLRKLGDRTLYICGFFSESLNRSLVDIDYYHTMGTSAYKALAGSVEAQSRPMFDEISQRYLEIVEVLNVISHDAFIKTDQGILRLYETFLRTGSSLAKQKLEALGVFTSTDITLKKASGH